MAEICKLSGITLCFASVVCACAPDQEPIDRVAARVAAGLPTTRWATEPISLNIADVNLSIPWFMLSGDTKQAIVTNQQSMDQIRISVYLPDFLIPGNRRESTSIKNSVSITLREMSRSLNPEFDSASTLAERIEGLEGPVRLTESIHYYHDARLTAPSIQRYYLFEDDELRRPDGTKPVLSCGGRAIEGAVHCIAGGWLSESVRWSYRFASTRVTEWLEIEEQVGELLQSLVVATSDE